LLLSDPGQDTTAEAVELAVLEVLEVSGVDNVDVEVSDAELSVTAMEEVLAGGSAGVGDDMESRRKATRKPGRETKTAVSRLTLLLDVSEMLSNVQSPVLLRYTDAPQLSVSLQSEMQSANVAVFVVRIGVALLSVALQYMR